MPEKMIERLDISQKSEALGVLKQAFATHPMLPPNTPIQTTGAMLELMIDTFRTEKAYLFGIRKEGTLACVSFSVDAHYEPKALAIIWFFFRLFRIAGWRLTKDFVRAFSKRPKYKDSYLELILLGTLPACHGQGLGRMMLQFLYDFSKERGYHGIILGVAKDTPAYLFYLRERFVVDKEVSLGSIRLCNTRRVNV
ncbi:MAG: GNAT family N-acetyltransferase [Planctomycetota bacterium]|jgi:GNAT superfamily N-acetyltransferase